MMWLLRPRLLKELMCLLSCPRQALPNSRELSSKRPHAREAAETDPIEQIQLIPRFLPSQVSGVRHE